MPRPSSPGSGSAQRRLAPETLVTSHAVARDPTHGAVAPPIHLATTYLWRDVTEKPAFDYSRTNNPTRRDLETLLAQLEGGASCVVTNTGMSAIGLVLDLIKPGDLVVAPHDCYGGTHRLLTAKARKGDFQVLFVDQTDEAAAKDAIAQGPRLFLIETPSNPLLRIVDIAALAEEAKARGALVCADNTFLSPARQQPIALGCDLVVHSTTKLINGHTDVVGGAVIAADPEVGRELAWWANAAGASGSPFDAYLTLRGMRTLFARVERQEATAAVIAAALESNPQIARVLYPGLASHPGHAIAARQQQGFGMVLSFDLAEGLNAVAFMNALLLITPAASLGGFETLACLPASMTHAGMAPEARAAAGVTDTLIRLSVGLESPQDLLADIEGALERAHGAG
jgi:cystathionine gamma-synthase